MRRVLVVLAFLLLLPGCEKPAAPILETDLLVRVEVGAREVELGRAFPVTVTRVWEKDLEPSEWDDASLSPLVVRLEEQSRREDEIRIEETWRYRGYAFTLEDVRVPPVVFLARPRDGGQGLIVKTDALRLRVLPALDPIEPGDPELPGTLHLEGHSWTPWVWSAGAIVLLLLGGAMLVHRRRPSEPPAPILPEPTVETPASRALAALEAIRGRGARDTDVPEAADVVRDYVSSAFGFRTRERTTEEVLAASPPAPEAPLRGLLTAADRVKYAAGSPSSAQRDAALDQAELYVEASGSTPS
jgi:hypothetical protein